MWEIWETDFIRIIDFRAKKQFKFLFLISDIHLQSFTTICGTDSHTNDSLFYHKNLLAI